MKIKLGDKVLLLGKKRYIVEASKAIFSSEFGKIDLSKLIGKNYGTKIKSHIKKEFILVEPRPMDILIKFKRGPQVIKQKDAGAIAAYSGLKNGARVVDAGTGTGWLVTFLSNIVGDTGKIITYEKRKEFFEIAKKNFKFANLSNVQIKNKDITKGIIEKKLDLITLDLPEPWKVIKHAEKSLKIGGYLAVYLPNMIQVSEFCNKLEKNKSIQKEKVLELQERLWKVEDNIARPEYTGLKHTGFLIFARKIK